MNATSVESMIAEYAANKAQADALKARNDELADELAKVASFNGNTAKMEGAGYKMTLTRRVNERWDQKQLAGVRNLAGDDLFLTLFRPKYEPQTPSLRAFMHGENDGRIKAAIMAACTTSAGRPTVRLEALA